ncbi:MAG: hypothetical protein IIV74_00565 [Alphaproteobacteria bacterium]|nr:hypothetical protein [Alphaproteobacteria bacterium]
MKFIRILVFSLFWVPGAVLGASGDFMMAAQLLAAAKSADIQQVQVLVNNGADVNFVDSTGLSIVCTALMNNDVRAAQILQMYGADASNCDRQIKKYNSKNKPKGGGGLFSGLSSAQGIGLAAAGAAVVVGGLFLLTDVFDPGNDNDSSAGGNDRPNNNPGGDSDDGADTTPKFVLPYGPAMPTAADETLANYQERLDVYSNEALYTPSFKLMTDGDVANQVAQNYLLIMHGYAPLARGYFGMETLRSSASNAPLDLSGNSLWGEPVMGGRPVNVVMVTANGINATANSSLANVLYPWTELNTNGTTVTGASKDTVSSKYYNNSLTLTGSQNSWSDFTVKEEAAVAGGNFDLAGYGTAIANISANSNDNLLAKIVGGYTSSEVSSDYIGFMPNGQMTIFRTGGGTEMATVADQESTGAYVENDGVLSQLDLFGKTMSVVINNGVITASYTETVTGEDGASTDVTTTYTGYIGTDGNLYIDSNADGVINQAYAMDGGNLILVKQAQNADYYNYKALVGGANLWRAGNLKIGRSRPEVLANADVIEPLRAYNAKKIGDVLAVDNWATELAEYVDLYYNVNTSDSYTPSNDAIGFFNGLGTRYTPLTVFSTGAFQTDSEYSGETLTATFENVVPLVFENSEHYFMSVVGVGVANGTNGTTSVSGYAPNKIALTQWQDSGNYYKARMCGVAGTGMGDVDPWCFASAGVTDEQAVASAAGAAGALMAAFPDLDNDEIFALMALTADGPFLGRNDNGEVFTKETLTTYLQNMYILPKEKNAAVSGGADYLSVFAEVFGYGLINLDRATRPGMAIYYYDGAADQIVSSDIVRAATNTQFRASAVLNLHGKKIRAPFFDVLESVDGGMSMPRIWENEFALGTNNERGLYMGDVLGDFKTRRDAVQRSQVGALGVTMAFSERAYDDNLNGLDNLSLDYAMGNWKLGASYQHYLTDGVSRFSGMSNPVMGLASNALVSDVKYNAGKWAFGARAFSGAITDEGLLEHDPTISSQYMPAKLGLVQGGATYVGWTGDGLSVGASIGNAHETNTILGAQTGGLLELGGGDTVFVDTTVQYKVSDRIDLTARATFAHTTSCANGEFVMGISGIDSNAFAFGANVGNFEFSVSQPLAITDGDLQYAYAEYDVVKSADNKYDLNVVDTHIENLSLESEKRELRLMGAYRHRFGEFTDGALGFIYRINPNHTDDFGNESIFMLKLSHRLGI